MGLTVTRDLGRNIVQDDLVIQSDTDTYPFVRNRKNPKWLSDYEGCSKRFANAWLP